MARGLHITPELVIASYDLCRLSAPIRSWRLPHPDQLQFTILTTRDRFAHFKASSDGRHEMAFSTAMIGTLDTLNRAMLHELCHLQAYRLEKSTGHGRCWKALRNRVCLHHHLDPKCF